MLQIIKSFTFVDFTLRVTALLLDKHCLRKKSNVIRDRRCSGAKARRKHRPVSGPVRSGPVVRLGSAGRNCLWRLLIDRSISQRRKSQFYGDVHAHYVIRAPHICVYDISRSLLAYVSVGWRPGVGSRSPGVRC